VSGRNTPRQYPRSARVNEVVQQVIAEELERLSDPRLGFVTITGVDVSADLRHADVFYTVLGSEQEHIDTAAGLKAAKSLLRSTLGRQVRMKYLPDLHFAEDPGLEQGLRIEAILREIQDKEKAQSEAMTIDDEGLASEIAAALADPSEPEA
jgi:ribosome-binding factor A